MPKFTLTIQADTYDEMLQIMERLALPESATASEPIATSSVAIATQPEPLMPVKAKTLAETPPANVLAPEPAPESAAPEPETPVAEEAAPASKKKGRPSTKKPSLAETLTASMEATKPATTLNGDLPDLDHMVEVIVAAVRAGRKTGDHAVEQMLPDFKQKTGIEHVMDAKDEHRQALYDFIHQAGLSVG
jgi:hypothetical protein